MRKISANMIRPRTMHNVTRKRERSRETEGEGERYKEKERKREGERYIEKESDRENIQLQLNQLEKKRQIAQR
jgi:hypothetical protein